MLASKRTPLARIKKLSLLKTTKLIRREEQGNLPTV
jgi:hypothetical protein